MIVEGETNSTGSFNLYEPITFQCNGQYFLFYDIFIRGREIVAIGPFHTDMKTVMGIEYYDVYLQFEDYRIKGQWVKDPHQHTVIIRFKSKHLASYLARNNEMYCKIIAGDIQREYHFEKSKMIPKGRLCLSTLQKNEYDYIRTWILYHQMIGVNHFYIYDNGSDDIARLLQILRPFLESGLVTLIKWHFPYFMSEGDNSGQTTQQNHTLYRFGEEWMVGLTDIDEYIVPAKTENLAGFLRRFAKLDRSLLGVFSGISLRTVWFGCNHGVCYDPQNFLQRLNFRKQSAEPRHQREKCIVFPKRVKVFSTHKVVRGRLVWFMPFNVLWINHYYSMSGRPCNHEAFDQVRDERILEIIHKQNQRVLKAGELKNKSNNFPQ